MHSNELFRKVYTVEPHHSVAKPVDAWKLFSEVHLSFPLAIAGLDIVRRQRLSLETEYMALIQIFDVLRRNAHPVHKNIDIEHFAQLLSFFKINTAYIQYAATVEHDSPDVYKCCLASNVCKTDSLVSLDALQREFTTSKHNPGFFIAYGSLWKSQLPLLESWQRLDSGAKRRKQSVWTLDAATGAAK
jgi:hypothetical protein